MLSRHFRALWFWCLCALFGALASGTSAVAAPAARVLDGRATEVDLWPATTVRLDPTRALSWADVHAQPEAFAVPDRPHPTFGVRRDVLWLRVPLDVRCGTRCPVVLDIAYTALARIDVHLFTDGVPVQHVALGHLRPFADRPLASRTHAAVLALEPGRRQELLVRVESGGALIVPLVLRTPAAFHAEAVDEQMRQGLLTGLGVCLLLYSLAQGLALREPLFLKYALMISGSLLFSVLQFGLGTQYLWTDNHWIEAHIGPLAALIASTGSFLFIGQVLAGPGSGPGFRRAMSAGAALSAALAVAYAFDALDTRTVSAIVSVLGLLPVLMGLPGAVRRALKGDPVGQCFLAAWAVYFVATAVMILMINGRAPVNFWTLHSFQFGATIDMLLFMRVLGLRVQDLQDAARRAVGERDALHSLAHTDPLTGLLNRRGLQGALEGALARRDPAAGVVAVYLLDLDGFKPVNDRHGHDAGDALLVAVAQRLRDSVRRGDTVARLGGDEFVVMSAQLADARDARALGEHLLRAFDAPLDAGLPGAGQLGFTIGYALAPEDATTAAALLKRADAAMFEGKSAGKGCLRRAGP